jgi:hypothetical protein
VRIAIAAVLTGLLTAGASSATAVSTVPSAFIRPQVAGDLFPRDLIPRIAAHMGMPYDSRRIATLRGTKRSWSEYVFKVRKNGRESICDFVVAHGAGGGAGGGCSPTNSFFGPGREVSISSGRVVAGVTTDRVARIVIVGASGVRHRVALTPDKGFIYNCRAYNGCSCVLSKLLAYDRAGQIVMTAIYTRPPTVCHRS